MSKKADQFLAKMLGEDFNESLAKSELWKPGTRTALDIQEIRIALKVVPRVVMALVQAELIPMEIGETKELHLSFAEKAMVRVTKLERDVYSGEIEQDNKRLTEFKNRSVPGVGLVIMSAFELYDMNEEKSHHEKDLAVDADVKVQKLIDERLAMHRLVEEVVEGKMRQRDAVEQILLAKLTDSLAAKPVAEPLKESTEAAEDPQLQEPSMMMSESAQKKKGSPVKAFLESRKKPKEFVVEMAKSESVHCPDCQQNIFDGKLYAGCICLGSDMDRKVFIKKTEDGVKVRFSKGWDPENIEMLLEVLRKKNA